MGGRDKEIVRAQRNPKRKRKNQGESPCWMRRANSLWADSTIHTYFGSFLLLQLIYLFNFTFSIY